MSGFLEVSGAVWWSVLLLAGGFFAAQELLHRFRVWRANRQGPPPIGIVARFDKPRTMRWRKVAP